MKEIVRFSFPTTVIFGAGSIQSLPSVLQEAGITMPLVVTDNGFTQTDAFTKVIRVLKDNSLEYALFADVHPNPLEEDVEDAGKSYQTKNCDGIIGVGGGSSLDVAKATAVRVSCPGELSLFEAQAGGVDRIKGLLPPIVAIPTTAGTGSEVGRGAVITIPSLGRKILIFSPQLMPVRTVVDPELTVGLPPFLTAATGMDAFTHNLESLTAPVFHPICDAIAYGGIELVIQFLERATKDGQDIEARGYMMIAAMMGAIAFQKDLGAAHSLAHPLSTDFGLHHGHANAICLPAVMRFNADVSKKEYARVAALFGVPTHEMSEEEAARRAAGEVSRLNERLGLPLRLRECDVPEEALPGLARKAFQDSCHATNPRRCTEEDLLQLYKESW